MPLSTRRNSTESWIMRHPLAAYLLLAFAITWLFWVPLAILYDGGSDLGSLLSSPPRRLSAAGVRHHLVVWRTSTAATTPVRDIRTALPIQ
jgi:hypothetical protein